MSTSHARPARCSTCSTSSARGPARPAGHSVRPQYLGRRGQAGVAQADPWRVPGQAELTIGSFDRVDVRATGNLPLGDTVALQGALLMRTRDGYTRNAFDGKDVNDQDVKGLRLSLLAEPTDRFRALLSADYIRERSTPGYAVPLTLNAQRDPLFDPVPLTGDFFTTNSDIADPKNDLDQWVSQPRSSSTSTTP